MSEPFGVQGLLPAPGLYADSLDVVSNHAVLCSLLSGPDPQNPSEGQRKPGGNAALSPFTKAVWGTGNGCRQRINFL